MSGLLVIASPAWDNVRVPLRDVADLLVTQAAGRSDGAMSIARRSAGAKLRDAVRPERFRPETTASIEAITARPLVAQLYSFLRAASLVHEPVRHAQG